MNKWDQYKRTTSIIKQSTANKEVNRLFEANKKIIMDVCHDHEIVNNTYLRMTYEFNPKLDFLSQFITLYRKLVTINKIDVRNEEINRINIDDYGMDKQTEE